VGVAESEVHGHVNVAVPLTVRHEKAVPPGSVRSGGSWVVLAAAARAGPAATQYVAHISSASHSTLAAAKMPKEDSQDGGVIPQGLADFLTTASGPCAPKSFDYDPYVKIRCGTHNPLHYSTSPVKNGGSNPEWTDSHDNKMVARRHPKDQVRIRDWSHAAIWQRARAVPRPNALVAVVYTQLTLVDAQGVVVLEVWDKDKYSRDDFVGGARCPPPPPAPNGLA
jgi:hypothetical protein